MKKVQAVPQNGLLLYGLIAGVRTAVMVGVVAHVYSATHIINIRDTTLPPYSATHKQDIPIPEPTHMLVQPTFSPLRLSS